MAGQAGVVVGADARVARTVLPLRKATIMMTSLMRTLLSVYRWTYLMVGAVGHLVVLAARRRVEGRGRDAVGAVFLQPLLVHVELHAQHEVGVLDHAVGDEEGHGR